MKKITLKDCFFKNNIILKSSVPDKGWFEIGESPRTPSSFKDISTTNLNPHDEVNKNNPFIYEGIDSTNDYRDFIVKKFDNNQMEFKECIINPYDFDMPLDVYKTQAKPQICEHEIDVYVKFGIHKNKAKVVVEFENFSFHPLRQQYSQRTENTGTSN